MARHRHQNGQPSPILLPGAEGLMPVNVSINVEFLPVVDLASPATIVAGLNGAVEAKVLGGFSKREAAALAIFAAFRGARPTAPKEELFDLAFGDAVYVANRFDVLRAEAAEEARQAEAAAQAQQAEASDQQQ